MSDGPNVLVLLADQLRAGSLPACGDTQIQAPNILDDWHVERWEGYETQGLNRYACKFLDTVGDDPFCLFLSPHQPHHTPFQFAPDEYYDRLPDNLVLPDNVPPTRRAESLQMYRHYLAMTLVTPSQHRQSPRQRKSVPMNGSWATM